MFKEKFKVKDLILKYGKSLNNSGSSSVQIVLLTKKINYLQKHFSKNKEDHCGRKGLLKMVSHRRKLLNYIKLKQHKNYLFLIKELGLRY